ncbi:MAG: hypothetical protein JXB38_10095 [Anaerolineales bacterium]|nr:hypothetical protein [Anaerolineales bacterium]
MLWKMIDIAIFFVGIYALCTGKFQLTRKIKLEGWRARVTGIILVIPTLVAFVIGFLVGLGKVPLLEVEYFGIVYVLVVLSAVFYAIVFSIIVNPTEDEIIPIEGGAHNEDPQ